MRITPNVYMVGSGQVGLSCALDCHVYLLDAGGELALIDAGIGIDGQQIIANIHAEGYDERSIGHLLLTHSHADHAGGAVAMVRATGAKVICSGYEARMLSGGSDIELGLDRARRSGIFPSDYVYEHIDADTVVETDQEFRLGRYTVHTIVVPGHSPGSVCYLVDGQNERMMFSGDTVFHGGTIGLGNWAGSSLEDYRRSIGRLAGLGVQALFPGHFMWTLCGGQTHLDTAVANMELAWVPPAWQHQHPHR